ncbi:hypothetical protein JRF84_26665, partial [Methylobacterium organophilum]|nr:hypothetical protein [Methylobacterium organophilum]
PVPPPAPPGPPPGPPPADAAGSAGSGTSASASASAAASTSTTSAARTTNDLLSTFIQQLQSSQSVSAGYGASGTANGGTASALLVDFRS